MKIKPVISLAVITGLLLSLLFNCKKEAEIKVIPTVTVAALTNITATSATSGGEVTSDGGATVTSRGVCWSASQNPTTADSKTSNSTGKGSFTCTITGLTPGAPYYVRAYAINSIGTAYSSQSTFTTLALAPILVTADLSVVTATSAVIGGNITNDGGDAVTARGVCWGTSQNPTIADSKSNDGTGSGSFISNITNLTPGTTYYVRAFATNSTGTGYGNIVTLKSLSEGTLRDCLQAYPGVKGEIVTASLNGVTVTCRKVNELILFQGDIVIGPQNKAASIDRQDQRWTDNKVYYTINDNFPNSSRIIDAFKEFNNTNILFQQRTNEANYVEFNYIKDAGCYSNIGMIGGRQLIVIDNWGNPADIAHEIGHALGLLHEQSKSTREQFVTIHPGNIQEGFASQFDIYPASLNTPNFDFNSLMLYDSYAFSVEYDVKPTITKKDGSIFKPQRDHFTETDILMINTLYPAYVTDIDGNVYRTLKIGSQTWMVENLRTTRFRNGETIGTTTPATKNICAETTSNYQWAYNGDESMAAKYGRLYTWFAVTDSRNLAPTGWHIPSIAEWSTLENYLIANGYNYDGTITGNKIAKSLAATTDWTTYNGTGTIGNDLTKNNSSGFRALPGSIRSCFPQSYEVVGIDCYWWSSTESGTANAWTRYLRYFDYYLGRLDSGKINGYYVRCVKD